MQNNNVTDMFTEEYFIYYFFKFWIIICFELIKGAQ